MLLYYDWKLVLTKGISHTEGQASASWAVFLTADWNNYSLKVEQHSYHLPIWRKTTPQKNSHDLTTPPSTDP